MQLRSLLKSHKIPTIISVILFSSRAWADVFIAPDCPSQVELLNGKIEFSKGWKYSIPKHFFDKDGNTILKSGIYKTAGKAPTISEINPFTNTVSSHVGADDEKHSDQTEVYIWKEPYNFVKTQAVFMCWLQGNVNDKPRGNIYLYKEVTKGISECRLTYYLHNGKRKWENQKMECK